ncbi:MAG: hypothetical protein J1D85_07705, partial [Bacteroidales bacterium]|nr:hypothetical protein [Bacteroidales bacterium]
MRKTLKFAVWTLATVAVLGCEKEQGTEVVSDGVVVREFTASFGEASTRTSLEGDGSVDWAAGDRIDYFSASYEGSISVPEAGPTVKMSVKMGVNDSWFTAVYGATGMVSKSADGSSFVISGAAPSEQDGLFPSAHVSVAHLAGASEVASSTEAKFKNLTSFLKFNIAGSGVARAEFSSNDGSGVSCGEKGLAEISFAEDGSFVASAAGTLGSSIAVRLDGAGTYYISLLPQTLEKGFTIKCFDAYGEELGAAKYTSRLEIKSSQITNLGTIDQRLAPSSPALSSIVFQPDFYFRSFGAVNYDFAGGNYGTVKNTAEGTDDEGAAFKVTAKN